MVFFYFVVRFGGLLVCFVGFIEKNMYKPLDIQNLYVYLSQMSMVFIVSNYFASTHSKVTSIFACHHLFAETYNP